MFDYKTGNPAVKEVHNLLAQPSFQKRDRLVDACPQYPEVVFFVAYAIVGQKVLHRVIVNLFEPLVHIVELCTQHLKFDRINIVLQHEREHELLSWAKKCTESAHPFGHVALVVREIGLLNLDCPSLEHINMETHE